MKKSRIEAFSDGVIAIIITIMVLEIKVPRGANLSDITPLFSTFLSYILSFVSILIYWNNHHHLFQAAKHINGKVLWANAHLLFWLSLLPFVSGWMGVNNFAPLPVLLYAIVTFMSGLAWNLLTASLLKIHESDSVLKKGITTAIKNKGILSLLLCLISIGFAYFFPFVSCFIFVIVPIMWLVPNKDIEKVITN
jgi:uncharacterized membrane protein